MSHFIYCIEAKKINAAKVGITCSPQSRISGIRTTAPLIMNFRHLLEVSCHEVASAYEKHIITTAPRYRRSGEWVSITPILDDLFSEISPAVCAKNAHTSCEESGRKITCYDGEQAISDAHLRNDIGPYLFAATSYESDGNIAKIHARLAEGYGAEDMLVMDNIPSDLVRSEVAKLRANGQLQRIMTMLSGDAA